MPGWECAIGDCTGAYGDVTDLLAHQVDEHGRHECRVCNAVVPEGFFAITHFFDAHTRADYVRAYDADSDDIRVREDAKATVEDAVDVAAVRERLDLGGAGEADETSSATDADAGSAGAGDDRDATDADEDGGDSRSVDPDGAVDP